MEKSNSFVKDGVLRLPPGFRFHPTDEELILQYLRRKVFSYPPLLASIIPEVVEVCKFDPWDLPGDLEHERYYFSTRDVKYQNGCRSNRATVSGYWKTTGMDKQVVISGCRELQVVGMKKTLVFYQGKPPKGSRTDWIMHEYRLANVETLAAGNAQVPNNFTQENCVLCRIFLKKRNCKGINNNIYKPEEKENKVNPFKKCSKATGKAVFHDFMGKNEMVNLNTAAPALSSSGSSGITEISCESDNRQEESSSCNSSSISYLKFLNHGE